MPRSVCDARFERASARSAARALASGARSWERADVRRDPVLGRNVRRARANAVRGRPSDRRETDEPPIDFHDAGARRPRRSPVVMVAHIFKKDWTLLWPLVTALAVLQGLLAFAR